MPIYVNRTLNLKHIKAIGFDMDHTLIRYTSLAFEEICFREMIRKLITYKAYPKEINDFPFDHTRIIRGLVIDKKYGNIMKLSLFGRVKDCYHGLKQLDYKQMQEHYKSFFVDVSDKRYESLDTAFSVSTGTLYTYMVDFVDKNKANFHKTYEEVFSDMIDALNRSHVDGSLKDQVEKQKDKFIIQDTEIPLVLEKLKRKGKRLFIVTNSDYRYTKTLMDFAFNPYLRDHTDWTDLFDVVITASEKPRFFTENKRLLKVDEASGMLINWEKDFEKGIFQGGNAKQLEDYFKLDGDEILYLGDHIYGDVVSLKRSCNWRTALVVEEIAAEVDALKKGKPFLVKIDELMEKKEQMEVKLFAIDKTDTEEGKKIFKQIKVIDEELSLLIGQYQKYFNPYWGPVMRAGQEESYIAHQIERYACIYMGSIADFKEYSTRHYFRPRRRMLPHDA